MSRILGKTFDSLNSMINNTGILSHHRDKSNTKSIPWNVTLDAFTSAMKGADSKQTEENLVNSYVAEMTKRLTEPLVSKAEIHEMIKICMTCEAIDYPTPFIYMHCLKLVQTGNLQEKQTGYTAATYFLHPDHELVILLINTFQRDLSSTNYLEVLLALRAICSLINCETVNHVLYLIVEKLQHDKAVVRKSAILALSHCLHLLNSESAFKMTVPKLEKAMTDNDLEVVAVAVSTLYKILPKLSDDFTYLIKCFVNLQDQILLRRVPRSMIYCDIPAPWLQLDILKFLKYLCSSSEHFQQVMPILKKTLQQIGVYNNISNAIIYQAIETLTVMGPSTETIEMVLATVSNFLKSKDINLKLTGIETCVLVVKHLKPCVTPAMRDIIYDCLSFPDETVQYKTLELLYHLTNESNVTAIVDKLMSFMSTTTNRHKRKELALKVIQLAEKFMVDKVWFIRICTTILKSVGDYLSAEEVQRIISYASKDDEFKEATLSHCLLELQQCLSPQLTIVKMVALALDSPSKFEQFLPYFLKSDLDENTWMWLLTSLMEVVLTTKTVSPSMKTILRDLDTKHDMPNQMLGQLLRIMDSNLKEYDPKEEIDPSLSFLDAFVVSVLESADTPTTYLPASFRTPHYNLTTTPEPLPADESFHTSFAEDSVKSPSLKSAPYTVFSSPSTSFQTLSTERIVHPPVTPKMGAWKDEGRLEETAEIEEGTDMKLKQDEKKEEMSKLFAGVS